MNNKGTYQRMLEHHKVQLEIFQRNAEYYFNKPADKWRRADIKTLKYYSEMIRKTEKAIERTKGKLEQC
jgi:hypothetical protein